MARKATIGDLMLFDGQPDTGNPYTATNRLEGPPRVAALRSLRQRHNDQFVLWQDSERRFIDRDDVAWETMGK